MFMLLCLLYVVMFTVWVMHSCYVYCMLGVILFHSALLRCTISYRAGNLISDRIIPHASVACYSQQRRRVVLHVRSWHVLLFKCSHRYRMMCWFEAY